MLIVGLGALVAGGAALQRWASSRREQVELLVADTNREYGSAAPPLRRAVAQYARGDFRAALEALQTTRVDAPQLRVALLALQADCYAQMDDLPRSNAVLEQALRECDAAALDSMGVRIGHVLGSQVRETDVERAIGILDAALKVALSQRIRCTQQAPDDPLSVLEIAHVMEALGDAYQRRQDFASAYPLFYHALGLLRTEAAPPADRAIWTRLVDPIPTTSSFSRSQLGLHDFAFVLLYQLEVSLYGLGKYAESQHYAELAEANLASRTPETASPFAAATERQLRRELEDTMALYRTLHGQQRALTLAALHRRAAPATRAGPAPR